ncbi:XRE family transcriptional regulator [Occultella glacieicola]|uniref:XRE family transcriptional regulator n=1 Tax=Occultella glacieicola TaxID=2518684 RepID=A0ABY2DZM0_9MICO|nr:helix-turn-helix transcriptional regulator [Occultella glacieicola]TDE90339.1 XRE family transcriptional regulator [Occultella glacieicola]
MGQLIEFPADRRATTARPRVRRARPEPAERVATGPAAPGQAAPPLPEPVQIEPPRRLPTPDHRPTRTPSSTPRPGDRGAQPRPLLWREAVGHALRAERSDQGRTQGDVASQAGVSTQYLSEIERGRKEPSSEILEAIGQSLGLDLGTLTGRVSRALRTQGPVLRAA